jgi:hypothetical protein
VGANVAVKVEEAEGNIPQPANTTVVNKIMKKNSEFFI